RTPADQWPVRATAALTLGGTLRAPPATGAIHAMTSSQDGHDIEASADVSLDSQSVQLTTLLATQGDSRLTGSLSYQTRSGALEGDVRAIVVDVGQLATLAGGAAWPIDGRGTVDAHV